MASFFQVIGYEFTYLIECFGLYCTVVLDPFGGFARLVAACDMGKNGGVDALWRHCGTVACSRAEVPLKQWNEGMLYRRFLGKRRIPV